MTAKFSVEGDAVPRQKYIKDLIKLGDYVKVEDGLKFTVDNSMVKNWLAQFDSMTSKGVKVPIVSSHKAEDSSDSRGWVERMYLDGDTLFAEMVLIGDDAILAAQRNDVSIYSPPLFVDGKGNKYKQPIIHVALTAMPVVPGLKEFVPIAASRTLKFAQGTSAMMEALKKLMQALGWKTEGITDENAMQMVDEYLKTLEASKRPPADPAADKPPVTPPADNPPTDPMVAASRNPLFAPMVSTTAQLRTGRIDGLLNSGHITKAMRDELINKFVGDGNKACALSLARGDDGSDFESTIKLLSMQTPMRLGHSATGAQVGSSNGAGDQTLVKRMEARAAAKAGK